MLDCEQALELISAKLDGALTAEESAQLEEHLAACPACRALLADFEELHMELPRLAAQPPADLKDNIMAEVRGSKVTPFQGKKKQWRWRSLASLAAVLVLVLVGSNALRQWDGAASRTAQAPAAGADVAVAQDTDNPAPAAIAPEEQEETGTGEKSGRNVEGSGGSAVQEKAGETESTAPLPTTVPAEAAAPTEAPGVYAVQPETRTNSAGLTQDEAVKKLALYLGWPEDSLTADSSGVLTGPSDDGVKRTITCTGLNEAGTGWVCQVEEISPGPDGTASCTTYTVPLDGSEITRP